MILVFLTHKKKFSFKFCDLDIENPLRRGTLAKFEPTLYAHFALTPPATPTFTFFGHATQRALPLLPEAIVSVSYGFVLVRVRVGIWFPVL